MKIAFLDRDGTIVKDYADENWKGRTVPEVLEGAVEGMALLNALGFEIIIVTNQYIINDGIITTEQYLQFTDNLINTLNQNCVSVLDIFYCPHSEGEHCACMKPKVGMIQMALDKYPQIDLEESIMIGDSEADEGLAFNIGLRFYRIDYNRSIKDVVENTISRHI